MKKLFAIVLSLMLFAMLFTGCSKKAEYAPYADMPSAANMESDYSFHNSDGLADQSGNTDSDPFGGRKVIRNAELDVQTLEFDAFIEKMNERIKALGGYVESSNINEGGYRYNGLRSASTVARIPAGKLDDFLAEIDGLGNITRRQENASDITDNYIDTEAKLASLRTEYSTLLDLLSKADSLDSIIMIQDRLSEVRYEIESFESRLRSYDSQIEFSKVSLSIHEVLRENAAKDETFGQEVSRRFRESLEDVGTGFANFAKWFIGNLPHIFVVLFILALPLIVVLIIVKSAKKRRAKRTAAQAAAARKEN